jgi:hypothetical protein
MSERIYVASRKGLLDFAATSGGAWEMARTSFVGEPVSAVLADARDGTLYAALNLGHFGVKLHRSEDGGGTWRELPAPAYPAAPKASGNGDGKAGPSLTLIWTLAAGGADQPGLLWAGTIPGGLFRSTDRGESWTLIESLWNRPERQQWFGGGYDEPGIHSVCVDPTDSRRLTLGVSCGGVWTSADAGESWTLGGTGLRAEYMPPDMGDSRIVQDVHRLAQCPAAPEVIWCQHHNGIFLTRDGGSNFTEIETAKPSAFGFAVAVHPRDPETAWFVPAVKDECRVPVDQRMVVSRTRDGAKTFETFAEGLPDGPSFDLVYRHGLDIDESGERLAMGSTTGNFWVGTDGGERWTLVSTHLPPIAQVAFAKGG